MLENKNNILVNTNDLLKEKFPDSVSENNSISVYNNAVKEYDLLKHGAGIRLLSSKAFIKLEGNDSLEFIHRISTNDVKSLEENKIKETIFTNEKGRILDYTKLINGGKELYIIGGIDNSKVLSSWLNRYIIMEDIKVSDLTEEFLIIELYGSQAESFLMSISGKIISEISKNKYSEIDFFDKKVKFFKSVFSENHLKYTLVINNTDVNDIINSLLETESVFDFGFVGEEAFGVFRIENEIPKFPNELNDMFNPHEVNLLNAVSFTKGCYIGQEVIARLDTYDKVQRTLKKICISDNVRIDELPIPIINYNQEESGYLTSFINSELLNKKIGLALIKKKSTEEELFVNLNENKIKLTLK